MIFFLWVMRVDRRGLKDNWLAMTWHIAELERDLATQELVLAEANEDLAISRYLAIDKRYQALLLREGRTAAEIHS